MFLGTFLELELWDWQKNKKPLTAVRFRIGLCASQEALNAA